MNPLDHPFWTALSGPQRQVAVGDGPALRYARSISRIAALERRTDAAFAALAGRVPRGEEVGLMETSPLTPPAGWRTVARIELLQMVHAHPARGASRSGDDVDVLELGPDDVPDMVALAEATRPGPFLAGSATLGRFVGIRAGGRLVAMAGERAHPPGHREIATVCTRPDHRRRGHARALVADLVERRREEGLIPFLHVFAGNVDAIRLYERMGFVARRRMHATVLRRTTSEEAGGAPGRGRSPSSDS